MMWKVFESGDDSILACRRPAEQPREHEMQGYLKSLTFPGSTLCTSSCPVLYPSKYVIISSWYLPWRLRRVAGAQQRREEIAATVSVEITATYPRQHPLGHKWIYPAAAQS